MAISPEDILAAARRWGIEQTVAGVAEQIAAYGNLLTTWNQRLALTSIRDESVLIERHLMEGVFAAAHHPPVASLQPILDFGSGTGIPGIPIALCRRDSRLTLAESQRRKASFLQEVVRQLGISAEVHPGRAETLPAASFGAVWMRAVEKSTAMLPLAADLVAPDGWLCLLMTGEAPDVPGTGQWTWTSHRLPASRERVLHIGRRA